jgi:hypothetical protein
MYSLNYSLAISLLTCVTFVSVFCTMGKGNTRSHLIAMSLVHNFQGIRLIISSRNFLFLRLNKKLQSDLMTFVFFNLFFFFHSAPLTNINSNWSLPKSRNKMFHTDIHIFGFTSCTAHLLSQLLHTTRLHVYQPNSFGTIYTTQCVEVIVRWKWRQHLTPLRCWLSVDLNGIL